MVNGELHQAPQNRYRNVASTHRPDKTLLTALYEILTAATAREQKVRMKAIFYLAIS